MTQNQIHSNLNLSADWLDVNPISLEEIQIQNLDTSILLEVLTVNNIRAAKHLGIQTPKDISTIVINQLQFGCTSITRLAYTSLGFNLKQLLNGDRLRNSRLRLYIISTIKYQVQDIKLLNLMFKIYGYAYSYGIIPIMQVFKAKNNQIKECLTAQEQYVLENAWLNNSYGLCDITNELNVSYNRAAQIQSRLFKKLRSVKIQNILNNSNFNR